MLYLKQWCEHIKEDDDDCGYPCFGECDECEAGFCEDHFKEVFKHTSDGEKQFVYCINCGEQDGNE